MDNNIEQSEHNESNEKIKTSLSETDKILERINTRIANDAKSKKCVKCGDELPVNTESKRCDDCREKRIGFWLKVGGGVATLAGIAYAIWNNVRGSSELSEEEYDEKLASDYEELRLSWLKDGDNAKRNKMYRIDREMVNRANEKYERENPDAKPVHRSHGWYLPSDD